MLFSKSTTLVLIQTKDGVFATEADAESPASGGGAFGTGDLHQVDVAVGGNEVHAAQGVRTAPGLPDGGPHLVPQLLSKLWDIGPNHKSQFVSSLICFPHKENL